MPKPPNNPPPRRKISSFDGFKDKKPQLKIFTCTDHDSHYVGGASVVIAENEEQARKLLDIKLKEHFLKESKEENYTLTEIPFKSGAFVLHDGEY